LGLGNNKEQPLPQKIEFFAGKIILDIFANYEIAFAVTNEGKVYGWGANDLFQLGLNHNRQVNKPELIIPLDGKEITSIVVGGSHCFALFKNSSVLCWGANQSGQIGTEQKVVKTPAPFPHLESNKLIQLFAGPESSFAISDDGELYAWGTNDSGELGLGVPDFKVLSPRKLAKFERKKVLQLSVGRRHCLALVRV